MSKFNYEEEVNLDEVLNHYSVTEMQLRESIINRYDYELTKINVEKIVSAYSDALYNVKFRPSSIKASKINQVPVFSGFNYSDKVSDDVEFICDNEIEASKLKEDIEFAYSRMTKSEQIYWNISVISQASQSTIMNALKVSRTGLIPIRDSCIIKFAMIFGIAVLKGQTKPENVFNSRINEIVNRD